MLRLKQEPFTLLPDQKVIRADEYAALVNAEGILEKAQERAHVLHAQTQVAYDSAKKAGFQAGLEEAKAQAAEQMVEAVSKTVEYFGHFEQKLVGIVMDALHSILGEMEPNELILRIVQKSLALVRNQKQITLQVHPSAATAVKESLQGILKDFPAIDFIDIQPDARLKPLDCILKSDIGIVDASLKVQLEAIQKALQKSVR